MPMKPSKAVDTVRKIVAKTVDTSRQSVAHRMDHLERVMQNAMMIARTCPAVDTDILAVAVLLHDVCQPCGRKAEHVDLSIARARRILQHVGVEEAVADRVLRVISEHSTETVEKHRPTSIEAKILFDADKLDGLGEVGIVRVFALFGQMGRPPKDAIPWYRGKIAVALQHLQTSEGRRLCRRRLPMVRRFIERLEAQFVREKRPANNRPQHYAGSAARHRRA